MLRVCDTEEDTELIQTYKKISLSGQSGKAGEWSTVSDQFQDGLQWACITDTNTQQALHGAPSNHNHE